MHSDDDNYRASMDSSLMQEVSYVVCVDWKNFCGKCVRLLKLLVILTWRTSLRKVCLHYYSNYGLLSTVSVKGIVTIKRDIVFAASLYL